MDWRDDCLHRPWTGWMIVCIVHGLAGRFFGMDLNYMHRPWTGGKILCMVSGLAGRFFACGQLTCHGLDYMHRPCTVGISLVYAWLVECRSNICIVPRKAECIEGLTCHVMSGSFNAWSIRLAMYCRDDCMNGQWTAGGSMDG